MKNNSLSGMTTFAAALKSHRGKYRNAVAGAVLANLHAWVAVAAERLFVATARWRRRASLTAGGFLLTALSSIHIDPLLRLSLLPSKRAPLERRHLAA